ncbi:MAG: hypothetical protein ACRCU2_00295 [Planktothrix sp.]
MNFNQTKRTVLFIVSSAILTGGTWNLSAEAAQLYNDYKYPWLANDANWQVTQGWHGAAGGFNYGGNSYSWGQGYALDFQAISNISSQGVNILAPADAEIASICKDDNNQASISLITLINNQLSLESMGIIHLEANSLNLSVGDRVKQGDFLGKVHREGTSFNDFQSINNPCGFGDPNHIHVRFPVRYPSFTIDGDTYLGNDTSITGKSVISSNTPPSENPEPDNPESDNPDSEWKLFKDINLSKKDELSNTYCVVGFGYDCEVGHVNLSGYFRDFLQNPNPNIEDDWNLLEIFSDIYAVEAAPFDNYITPIQTQTFNVRNNPASSIPIASPPWGTQGKLLNLEPVIANFNGREYDWWNVDFFGYGSGWVAGHFMYQRFHNNMYSRFGFQDWETDENGIIENSLQESFGEERPSSQKVPEPGSLLMLLVPLIAFFKKFK